MICLIVQKYGYCQKDTTLPISKKTLAKIYTDLTICETSRSSCQQREVLYLDKLYSYIETSYNDSIIIEQLNLEKNLLTENKIILEKSKINLVKSNKLLKLTLVSLFFGLVLETLIIAL